MFAKGPGGVHDKHINVLSLLLDKTKLELETVRQSLPDDIREKGWTVAVHNDYRLNGKAYTFWLFTKGERAIKGEGETDAEALNIVRLKIKGIEQRETEEADYNRYYSRLDE